MTIPLAPIPSALWYHLAVARFQAEPQGGVPGGTGRYVMGRPLEPPTEMYEPPM